MYTTNQTTFESFQNMMLCALMGSLLVNGSLMLIAIGSYAVYGAIPPMLTFVLASCASTIFIVVILIATTVWEIISE